MQVRTRFAPSPTGFLHIGGVRTALFSWVYAKHHKGAFILRVEDTDKERSTKESVNAIIEGMQWLGLEYDEGPFFQTNRYERYDEIINQLLNENKAYRCYCTKERLQSLRDAQMSNKEKPRYDGHCRDLNLNLENQPFVVRFKNPIEGNVEFSDQVYGNISVDNKELDDLVIMRTDGNPTYNFTVVVDDWDMKITHVIRGDDHINNTPRQINLFKALNAPLPIFAHLPMILGEDGKRLSKRHGAVSVLEFKEQGILPHALLNYLARLGWSFKDQEIFSRDELIKYFDLANVSRAAASFNYEKLLWLNQHYQKFSDVFEVANALSWHFKEENIDFSHGPKLTSLVAVQAERCKTLREMCDKSRYFYEDSIEYDKDAVKKHLRPAILEALTTLYNTFKNLDEWKRDLLQNAINHVSAEYNFNMGKIAQPLRVAVTGSSMSPSIDATLELIGKERVLQRLDVALEMIKERSEGVN